MDSKFEKFNEYLNSLPLELLQAKADEDLMKNKNDFVEFKKALALGRCSYCGNPLTHYSNQQPCFHWLLWKSKKLKKKHFEKLFNLKSYHQIEAYLRWVANAEAPMKNINDIVEEKNSSKFIETTIKYKNIEWSFSCSYGDRAGHTDSHEGKKPHYHFQMKIDENVVINYNGFHIPFNDYDEFCFAVEAGQFDRLKHKHIQGAGMQTLLDSFKPEELLDMMEKAGDEESSQFHLGTMITADENTTISGDDIANLVEERKKTGLPLAILVKKLKNVRVQTIISPGPGIPLIASRKRNRGSKKQT